MAQQILGSETTSTRTLSIFFADGTVQSTAAGTTAGPFTGMTLANVVLSTGWGVGAGVSAFVVSQDGKGIKFLITSGSTTVLVNPTITLTWASALAHAPVIIAKQGYSNDSANSSNFLSGDYNATTTGAVLTWTGTPSPSKTYGISILGVE